MRKMILSSADDLSVLAAFVQCRRNTQQGKYPSPYQAVAEGEERRAASSTETEAVPVREGAVAAVVPRDSETRGRGGEDHGCGGGERVAAIGSGKGYARRHAALRLSPRSVPSHSLFPATVGSGVIFRIMFFN